MPHIVLLPEPVLVSCEVLDELVDVDDIVVNLVVDDNVADNNADVSDVVVRVLET